MNAIPVTRSFQPVPTCTPTKRHMIQTEKTMVRNEKLALANRFQPSKMIRMHQSLFRRIKMCFMIKRYLQVDNNFDDQLRNILIRYFIIGVIFRPVVRSKHGT